RRKQNVLSFGNEGDFTTNCVTTPFAIAAFFVFLAEMGDKTQLVALAFATRYNARIVLAGVFVATLLVHLLSVALGEAAGTVIPVFWIKLVSGVAFIVFGIWTIYGDEIGDEGARS